MHVLLGLALRPFSAHSSLLFTDLLGKRCGTTWSGIYGIALNERSKKALRGRVHLQFTPFCPVAF